MNLYGSLLSLILFLLNPGILIAGQAQVIPAKELIDRSALIAVVQVLDVTEVEVSRSKGQKSVVYVAQAEVLQGIKPNRKVNELVKKNAIVGSTIPLSSAVWKPIKKKHYLAFLNPDQGHYRYDFKIALREISEDEKVDWYDYDIESAEETYEAGQIDLEDAIQKIHNKIDFNKPVQKSSVNEEKYYLHCYFPTWGQAVKSDRDKSKETLPRRLASVQFYPGVSFDLQIGSRHHHLKGQIDKKENLFLANFQGSFGGSQHQTTPDQQAKLDQVFLPEGPFGFASSVSYF